MSKDCQCDGTDDILSALFQQTNLDEWDPDSLRRILDLLISKADARLYNMFYFLVLSHHTESLSVQSVVAEKKQQHVHNVKESPQTYSNNQAVCLAILFVLSLRNSSSDNRDDDDDDMFSVDTLFALFRAARPDEWEPDHLMFVVVELIETHDVTLLDGFLKETKADWKSNTQLMYTIVRTGLIQELSNASAYPMLTYFMKQGLIDASDIPGALSGTNQSS
jgi:hypothetical protein